MEDSWKIGQKMKVVAEAGACHNWRKVLKEVP